MTPDDGKGGAGGAQDTAFVVACGTGLDARLIAATSHEAKRRQGVAAVFGSPAKSVGALSG